MCILHQTQIYMVILRNPFYLAPSITIPCKLMEQFSTTPTSNPPTPLSLFMGLIVHYRYIKNSNLALRLREIEQKKLIIHQLTSMWFLLPYSPNSRSQVGILIYRKWSFEVVNLAWVKRSTDQMCYWHYFQYWVERVEVIQIPVALLLLCALVRRWSIPMALVVLIIPNAISFSIFWVSIIKISTFS